VFTKLPLASVVACSQINKKMKDLCFKNEVWEALFLRHHPGVHQEVAKRFMKEEDFWRLRFQEYHGSKAYTCVSIF
jgi:hypothetical protein